MPPAAAMKIDRRMLIKVGGLGLGLVGLGLAGYLAARDG